MGHRVTAAAVSPCRPERLARAGTGTPFALGLFLAVWVLAFGSVAAFFAPYPVLMQRVYGIGPGISAAGFAVAAGLGLALYSPAGRWSDRLGPARALQLGLVVRLLAFAGLPALGLLPLASRTWPALLGFAFVVLAWSLLSVSGTALAADLSPVGEGTGLGIFNAATAVAGVLGAVAGGWAAGRWAIARSRPWRWPVWFWVCA